MAGKDQGACGLGQSFCILSMLESQWTVLRKGEKWGNTCFAYVFLWLLCGICTVREGEALMA